jgi:hypothetical protein
VYLNVACFPARKTLPNGDNAHATVRPPQWWSDLMASRATTLWELHAAHQVDGRLVEKVYNVRTAAATLSSTSSQSP